MGHAHMTLMRLVMIIALSAATPRVVAAQCPRAEVVEVMPMATAETRPVVFGNRTIQVNRVPLATLEHIVKVGFDAPWAIQLTFTREAGERMERITARPNFPMAFVVDDEALVSVVLEGGYGIGKDGLQVSLDSNEQRVKRIYDTLSRCISER
jgi:hypothetical protein